MIYQTLKVLTPKMNDLLNLESIRSKFLWFILFLLVACAFYYKASNALLIDDGIAGLVKFENMGYRGFLTSFGFTSLYYFHDFFNLLVYLIVGKSSFGWFAVMVTLHSFNAMLSFSVFQKFYSMVETKNAGLIALTGSVLFLLSPYQTENVVWAATLHYSIAMCIFLVSSGMLLDNLKAGHIETKTVLIILALFIVSLLTLEISLVFPFAYACLAGAVIWNKKSTVKFTQLITRFILPLLGVIAIYFIATRVIKGHWIPHYGETHLLNNTIKSYSINTARYLLKLSAFIHYADYPIRELVYMACERWEWVIMIEVGLVTLIIFLLTLFKKRGETKTFICMMLFSFVLLLPSLHMYFMYLFNVENDRLSYFFSLGLYQLLPFVLIAISPLIGTAICIGYLFIGGYFLHQQVNKWHEAALVHNRCVKSFVWADAPKVYILNVPTNYKGVYEFRNNERLPYALDFFKNFKKREKIISVLSSNYTSLNDSTIVSVINDSTLLVTIENNGGWLMNEFVGATDYSNDEVDVRVLEGAHSYQLTVRKKIPGSVFVYSTSNGFYAVPNF